MSESEIENWHDRRTAMRIVAELPPNNKAALRILKMAEELLTRFASAPSPEEIEARLLMEMGRMSEREFEMNRNSPVTLRSLVNARKAPLREAV